MQETTQKPYLIRAIHEWCEDNDYKADLLVVVNDQTHVPMAYVRDGEIVLNISYGSTQGLTITNEHISFSARFSGQAHDVYIPVGAVKAIMPRGNNQGMFFETAPVEAPSVSPLEVVAQEEEKTVANPDPDKKSKKPTLKVIK